MHEEMRKLLNAYLDEELHGTRQLEVTLHLAACQACREELRALRQVSVGLRSAAVPAFMPVERFAANLAMHLPRRTLVERPSKPGSLAWWLVPAGIVVAWFFVQTVFVLTGVVSVADSTGMMGMAADWLGGGREALWFDVVQNFIGGQSGSTQAVASSLNEISLLGGGLLNGFLIQAGLVLVYWGWLTLWWLRRGPRPMKVPVALAQ